MCKKDRDKRSAGRKGGSGGALSTVLAEYTQADTQA